MIFFSIIIAAYNAEKTIGRCLNSLIAQKYKRLEIIMVDDGSTDETVDVAASYSNKMDLTIIKGDHAGVSAARNLGLLSAGGQWITFLDADDALSENALFAMSDFIEQSDPFNIARASISTVSHAGGKPSDCAFCETPVTFRQGNINNLIAGVLGCNSLYHDLKNVKMLGCSAAVYYKRSFLLDNSVKFNEDVTFMEDLLFLLDALSKSDDCIVLPFSTYLYYTSDSAATKTFTGAHLSSIRKVGERVKRLTNRYSLHKECVRFEWSLVFLSISLTVKSGGKVENLFAEDDFQSIYHAAAEAAAVDMAALTAIDWLKFATVRIFGRKCGFAFK